MDKNQIKDIEKKIDSAFSENPLNGINYSQSLWTVLSVLEDKYQHPQIYALLNAISHPISCIYKCNSHEPGPLIHELIDDHYGWANEWIDKAFTYDTFNTIFPLYWKGKISIEVEGDKILIEDWRGKDLRYDAYNMLVRKDGDIRESALNNSRAIQLLKGHFHANKNRFQLNLTQKLVESLVKIYSNHTQPRHTIPDDWSCCYFDFGDFKKVFTTIQSILYGRFILRATPAPDGLGGLGYSDSVWVLSQSELANRLSRYTSIERNKIEKIIEYLTFGSAEILHPDIAIQPIVDLGSKILALSPLIFLNSNSERNFCVLLNKIPKERDNYTKLTNGKEELLRNEIIIKIKNLGYRTESGKLKDTDVDLAIIDDKEKLCLILELKWFIEPSEIREILDRSKELKKGIDQAKNIESKFLDNDKQLIKNVLKIDRDYELVCAVGSRNWIGNHCAQCQFIPIIKIKHFVHELKERKCLRSTVTWLKNRDYLPTEDVDFYIVDIPINFENWNATWYSIMI